jgi:transposase
MYKLSTEERTRIVSALVEGNSIRAVSRMFGASRNTIDKLLRDLGRACSEYQVVAQFQESFLNVTRIPGSVTVADQPFFFA